MGFVILLAGCAEPIPEPLPDWELPEEGQGHQMFSSPLVNHTTPNIQPLEYNGVYIGSSFPLHVPPWTLGKVDVCTRSYNRNPLDIIFSSGIELYRKKRTLTGGEELEIMERNEAQGWRIDPNETYGPIRASYWLPYQIFVETGGHHEYAVHVWHEILVLREHVKGDGAFYFPKDEVESLDPPLREDRWYNVTVMPLLYWSYEGNDSSCYDD